MKELSGEKTFDQFLFYSFGLGILFRSHCNRHPLRLSSLFSPVDHDRSSIYLGGALLVSTWSGIRVFDSADCQGQTATLAAIQKIMPQLQMIPELLDCGSDGISDRSIAAADMFPSVRPFCAIGRYSRQYTWTHQIVFSQVLVYEGIRRRVKDEQLQQLLIFVRSFRELFFLDTPFLSNQTCEISPTFCHFTLLLCPPQCTLPLYRQCFRSGTPTLLPTASLVREFRAALSGRKRII